MVLLGAITVDYDHLKAQRELVITQAPPTTPPAVDGDRLRGEMAS
jgi:hypothetical protein